MALGDLGISPAAEHLYALLVEEPGLEIAGIADRAHLGPDETAAAIGELTGKNLIRPDESQPAGVVAIDPAFALGRLVEKLEDDLIGRYRRVAETRSEIARLAARFAEVQPAAHDLQEVERVVGIENVRERLDELSFFARSSIMSIQPGGPQSKAALDASRRLDQRTLARKIVMRVIHEMAVLGDETNRAHLRELIKLGVDARVSDQAISRMVIIDEAVAVVPLNPIDTSQGALVVRHPGLVAGFVELFEHSWRDSKDVPWLEDDVVAMPEPAVSEQDRRILYLLASGRTDEAAARDLGCSVRHVRRLVARLMDELGAASRFEAGVEAARRGWL